MNKRTKIHICFIVLIAFMVMVFYLVAHIAHGQVINPLDQWISSSSPSTAITQRVYGKALKLSGQSTGCAQFDSSGVLTSTGTVCGGGGGSGTVNSGTTGQVPYYAADGTTLTTTSTLFLSTGSNVGIGTPTPAYKLDVNGTANFSGAVTYGSSVSWSQAPASAGNLGDKYAALESAYASNGITVTDNFFSTYYNVVGPNTANPGYLDYKIVSPNLTSLTISGVVSNYNDGATRTHTLSYSQDGGQTFTVLTTTSFGATSGVAFTGTITTSALTIQSPIIVRLKITGGGDAQGLIGWTNIAFSSVGAPLVFNTGSQPRLTLADSGIGINTSINSSVVSALDVNSTNLAYSGAAGTVDIMKLIRPFAVGDTFPQVASFAVGSYAGYAGGNPQTRLDINLKSIGDTTYTADTNIMSLLATGNVGISTTSPWKKLSVSGDMVLTGGLFDSLSSAGTNGMVLQSTGSATKWVATSTLGLGGGGSGTVTSVATNNGLTGGTITTTGTIGLATIAANSVLANSSSASAVPTALATSSLFQNASASVSGLLTSTDWNTFNNKGSGSVTSVSLTTPTGLSISGSPVTTTGTLALSLTDSSYSLKKLPTYTVAAAGGDFTTIQAALNACGTAGGGTIYLTDTTYAQAGTGLLWKGSDCNIYGRDASTTITFTGATTLFKTNSAVGLYSNNGIHHVVITGDGNTGGVVIDASDMSHSTYEDVKIDNVGTAVRLNDTQNITFYNNFNKISATTLKSFGINASSTKPANDNSFQNIFIGCSSGTGCVGINLNNNQANIFNGVTLEPAGTPATNQTTGIQIRANSLANNNGTFSNEFHDMYIEGNTLGIAASSTVGSSVVYGNNFYGGQVETNTTNTLFQSADQFEASFFGVGLNFINTNILGATTFRSKNNGTPISILDDGFSTPAFTIQNNNNFAHNSLDFVKYSLLNGSDSSNLLNLNNLGTGATIIATSTNGTDFILTGGKVGIGTSTPTANLQVTAEAANATTSAQFGKANQSKGTCITYYDTAGSPVYMYFAAGATTPTYKNGGTAPSGCQN